MGTSRESRRKGPTQSRLIERYLQLGWPVLPTSGSDSKRPDVGDNWQHHPAVTDPAAYEGRGIYLICGERSGVDVIDIDSDEHRAPLAQLAGKHRTPTAATPSGGLHIFVRHDRELEWRNSVRTIEGVDLRTQGGGVVVPSGGDDRRWRLAPWQRPAVLADPGPFDRYVRDHVDQPTTQGAGEAGPSLLVPLLNRPAEVGGRNHWLAKVASHYSKHFPYWEMVEWHIWAANDRLPVPLEPEEVRSTVLKSARRWWCEVEPERRQLRQLRKAQDQ